MNILAHNFKIASFYTRDTAYENIIQNLLVTSCREQQIEPIIVGIENQHRWIKNVAEKPRVIGELLEKYDRLVFLDADATLQSYPGLFNTIPDEYDIAFHRLNWNTFYGHTKQPPIMELLSGTMFFRNRPEVKALCKAWYEDAKKTHIWEQKVLERVIKSFNVKVYDLPIEYCSIKNPRSPLVVENPVIVHHQKSREYKKGIV